MSVTVIGVVGARFMGSGIAESAAAAGKHVVVYEPDSKPFERSRHDLVTSVGRAVSRGKLDREEGERVVDRVLYTTRFEDLGGADAVIDAITEDLRIKSEMFRRLGEELSEYGS
jgi:3-hydroxybutyryl-CoA dehydrogenase